MEEQLAALRSALAAAGMELPEQPASLTVDDLDAIADKQLRGKAKSALVKFKRVAVSAAPASEPAAAPMPPAPPATVEEPANKLPEPTPAEAEPVADPGPTEAEEVEEPADEEPMPAELAGPFEAVSAAFAAAEADLPDDFLTIDLGALDERIEDKQLRGKAKSALVKFRRAAAAAGWQPAPRAARAKRQATATGTMTESTSQAAAAPVAGDVPALPEASPADLFLLTTSGWEKLGTATRQPSHADELVGHKTASGATQRVNCILILDGKFDVPEDLYNTTCFLAHEDVIYKAYYISHLGDVKRGTKTASLKVERTFTYAEFAEAYVDLGKTARPTADDARRHRFGLRYETPRDMFAERSRRLA